LPGNHGAGLSHRCLWLGPSIENMRMRL
jgi:hypothetical protein